MSREALTFALQLLGGVLIGALAFLLVVPGMAFHGGADGFTIYEDHLTYTASLRYFIWDEWRWPLFLASGLGPGEGTVLVFTDAIPIYAAALKLARPFITPEFNFLAVWLAFCYVAQGVSAVAAVRAWGVRRWAPVVAAAVLAVSLPAWIDRLGHSALSFQAPLLLSCGLLGVARAWPAGRVAAAGLGLAWFTLTINPYLFVMVLILDFALLAYLVERGWALGRAARSCGLLLGVTALEGYVLGYFEPHGVGHGFTHFSMNLLSPIDPPQSSLLTWFSTPQQATTGQYEGLNYLGLGLLTLVATALWCEREHLSAIARHYRAHLIAAMALTALSLSTTVYLGQRMVLFLPSPPSFIAQFRAPGRFFWPVAYLLLVAVVVALARRGRGFERWLVAAALVQWVDVSGARRELRKELLRPPSERLHMTAWRPLIAQHARVVVAPTWECARSPDSRWIAEVVYQASASRTPISTVYSARPVNLECADQGPAWRTELLRSPETLAVVFDVGGVEPPAEAGWRCARFSRGRVCSALPEAAAGLAAIGPVAP